MQDGDILQLRDGFREFDVIQFIISNHGAIHHDAHHYGQQLMERVSFMKAKNKGKPLFRIIINHSAML